MGLARFAVLAMALIVLGAMAPVQAVGGEGESWPSFNESPGCGSPWSIGPNAEAMGPLGRDTILRGPQAAYFGRTVVQVADSLVPWAVPMSDGEVLNVHRRILPALQNVAATLTQATTLGRTYEIFSRQTFGYTSRTVGGRYRISQHSFGNAVDVNSWSNPSTEGPLVTDMPSWFVQAWTDAGFCWGGVWIEKNDAMHFSWRGPALTASTTKLLEAYPPLTVPEDFSRVIHSQDVPAVGDDVRFQVLMDADGDSAIDVVSLANRGESLVVEVVSARSGYVECAIATYEVLGRTKGFTAIPGDWDGDGISDIWLIDDTDGIVVSPLLRRTGYSPAPSVRLDIQEGDRYLAADFDVDGWSDLYILRHTGQGWNLEIRSGQDRLSSVLATAFFPGDATSRFTAIDRDLDQVPDLVALGSSSMLTLDGASGLVTVEPSSLDVTGASDIAGTDFDGDGRHDLAVLVDGELTIHAGNTPLDGADPTSWFLSPDFMCDAESTSNAR